MFAVGENKSQRADWSRTAASYMSEVRSTCHQHSNSMLMTCQRSSRLPTWSCKICHKLNKLAIGPTVTPTGMGGGTNGQFVGLTGGWTSGKIPMNAPCNQCSVVRAAFPSYLSVLAVWTADTCCTCTRTAALASELVPVAASLCEECVPAVVTPSKWTSAQVSLSSRASVADSISTRRCESPAGCWTGYVLERVRECWFRWLWL